jgi:coenzyme PQQ synthesis protein D (PqqD)
MKTTLELKQLRPVARTRNLIIKELPGETLIYDLDSDKAHCLNQTAALVWKNCDGEKTASELRELLEQELSTPVPEEIVWLALDQLQRFHLLTHVPARPSCLAGTKRRELVKHIGIAALTLPLIMSLSAPTSAQAGSPCSCTGQNCRPPGCPCTKNGDCMNKCENGFCT